MTTEEKRQAIARVYPWKSWEDKVSNMCESQVIAVYLAFEKNGTFRRTFTKFDKPFRKPKKKEKSDVKQLSIDDILKKE
jgi:hypothetical protein